MISDVMANNNGLAALLKNDAVVRNADAGKPEENTENIKDGVKRKFEESNPDLYHAMQEAQKEITKLQLEQTLIQKEQMLSQLQMQIQKVEHETVMASLENEKVLENMKKACFNKLYQMGMEMDMATHSVLMKTAEGWVKALMS